MPTSAEIITSASLLATCFCLSGCMTANTIALAKGSPREFLKPVNTSDDALVVGSDPIENTTKADVGYYVFIPVTLAADIVTSPVQIWAWLTDYHACK
jgi:hypothetical protein